MTTRTASVALPLHGSRSRFTVIGLLGAGFMILVVLQITLGGRGGD